MERTEQIIKALECCTTGNQFGCDECPCEAPTNSFKGSLACNDEMMKKALALIKKQQKELTYCYDKLTELETECLGLSLHNITLKKENKYLRERLAEEAEIKEDMKGK